MNTAQKQIAPERLLEVVAAVAKEARPHVEPHAGLDTSLEKELGLDSLARVELVLRLEKEFGVALPEQALATSETPRDLLRFLLGSVGHEPQASPTARSRAWCRARACVRPPMRRRRRSPKRSRTTSSASPTASRCSCTRSRRSSRLRYQALWDGAMGYAARLAQAGLQPGQMVAIMLPTCKEYLYCFYGVMLAGGVPVPLYPPARLTTIEDHMSRHVGILKSAGATIMVTIPEAKPLAYLLRAQVESLNLILTPQELNSSSGKNFNPVHRKPGDMGFLQYTSGSTGSPKGVVLSHANLMANVRAMGAAVNANPADVFVSWLPLYHDLGLIGANFASLVLGFPTVLMSPLAFLSRPASWMRAIHRHRGTMSGGPNFSFELCLRRIQDEDMEGIDLSSWRFAFNAAEPVSPDTIVEFEKRFAKWGLRKNCLSPSYGLAESSVGVAITVPGTPWRADRLDRERFTRAGEAIEARADDPSPLIVIGCGTPIPGHDIRVVDSAGLELPDRQEGQLQFRGPSSTSGYYRNPEATKTLFGSDDWLNTGDRAYLSEGTLFLTGREKDIIIRGGRNISPYELEQAVGDLAGVRRGCVAVFGSKDAATGTERVVVLAEMRDKDALAPRRPEAHDQRPRREPDRRARGRHRARAAGHRAQDLQRQDPPRRGARVLRARAAGGGGRRGVAAVRAPGAGRRRAAAAPLAAHAGRRAVRAARVCCFCSPGAFRAPGFAAVARQAMLERRPNGIEMVPDPVGHPGCRQRTGEPGDKDTRGAGGEPHQLPGRAGPACDPRLPRLCLRRQARVPGQLPHARAARRASARSSSSASTSPRAPSTRASWRKRPRPAHRSSSSPKARSRATPASWPFAPAPSRPPPRPASRWCRWRCAAYARCCATAPGT